MRNQIDFGAKKQMSLCPQTIRIQYRLAQGSKQGRKHWDLYRHLMDPYVLLDALKLVLKNRGSAGIDGQTCQSIQKRQWEFVVKLAQSLRDRTYRPRAVRRVYIPKADGTQRPLGIPTLRDRTVQRAVVLLLEPIYEQEFLSCSYGFRPGRSAMECAVDAAMGTYRRRFVIEADIESFFDRVVHRKLKGMLRDKIVDPRIHDLISSYLTAGFIEKDKPWEPTKAGTPQGGPLSPLLANIYLHYALDKRFAETASEGEHTKMYRYADDFIIVTDHPARLKSVRRALYVWMREAGLKLKETKTCEIDMSNERRSHQSHFDFLGYRFHLRAFRDSPKRFWIARQPSEKSRKHFRRKLKERLVPNLSTEDAKRVLDELWRGWCGYFRYGNANRVMYREKNTVKRAVLYYLRRKFRHQRCPVRWQYLYPIALRIWSDIRPPQVIPGIVRQNAQIMLGI